MRRTKISTQELGLILGSRILPHGDLHYGYWAEGLEVCLANLHTAQVAYSDFLIGHIPGGTESILDVGMGTGVVSEKLTAKGFCVEGVSPSAPLTDLARRRLGEEYIIYSCPFQELETESRYDLVLFSESFQYIPMRQSLPKAHELLNPGGRVLILDFFKTEAEGRSPIGGGHRLTRFRQVMKEMPFEVVEDLDITPQTAPTIELFGDVLRDYAVPVYEELGAFFRHNHPWLHTLVGKLFGKRMEKVHYKLFSNRLNGASFSRYRNYRLLLLRKR